MTIGERIKAARKAANMTQQELADKLGVSGSMIAQYETDKRNPKRETLQRIAEVLKVPWANLAGEKSIEYTFGQKAAKDLQQRVDAHNGIIALLRDLYGQVEDKEVSGLYGSNCYYRIGTGKNAFVLYDGDIESLKDFSQDAIRILVERIKDTRPELEIIAECEAELSSESTRKAMLDGMKEHIKKFPGTESDWEKDLEYMQHPQSPQNQDTNQ